MSALVCGHCGSSNPPDARFCENCDGFLDWEESQQVPDPAPAPTRASSPPAQPRAQVPQQPAPRVQPQSVQPPRVQQPNVQQPNVQHRSTAPTVESMPFPLTQEVAPPPLLQAPPLTSRQCMRCGTENELKRRFCRHCGEWLVNPSAVPRQSAPTMRERWFDRWRGGRGAYQGDLSRSTVVFRTITTAIAVVVIAALLGVLGFSPLGRARDAVAHTLGSGRVETGLTATVENESVPDHLPEWAIDNFRGRGWATKWSAPTGGDPEAACTPTASAADSTLVLTLASPLNVREIGFEAGLAKGDALQKAHWRPRTIELRWGENGECRKIDLKDGPELQRFRVDEGDQQSVKIRIVSAYPANPVGSDVLDISEVTLWHR